MPPPRTVEESIGKLQNLPAAQLRDFLAALARGDLETAKKVGGLSRAELIGLRPSGESGQQLDGLEQQTVFQFVRKARLAVLGALPGAVATLAAIAEGPACIGDVEAAMDKSDVPLVDPALAPHEQEAAQRKIMSAIAAARVPNPKNLSEKRNAALNLVDLAQRFAVFDLATAYRAPDEQADDEATLQRMAREQGIELPGLPGNGKPERLLRSVPFAS